MKNRILSTPLVLAASLVALVGCSSGCARLSPGADPIEVRAEQTVSTTADTLDLFETLDDQNTELLREKAPSVHALAEDLRTPVTLSDGWSGPRGLGYIHSATAARRTYKANRSPDNKATLTTALATLETVLAQTQAQLTAGKAAVGPFSPLPSN